MPYFQIKDVLNRVRDFHTSISAHIGEMPDQSNRMRVRLLLDYVAMYETCFSEVVKRYEEIGEESVLNMWIQFVPETKVNQVFEEADLSDDDSIEEVVKLVFQSHERIFEIFKHFRDASRSSQIAEFFDNLLAIQQQRDIERVRALLGMHDL